MGLNRDYAEGFLRDVDQARAGDATFLPLHLKRVDEVFNLMQHRYYLLFGATGTGKTAFMDYSFILSPWAYKQGGNMDDVHWEVIYLSLERHRKYKHAKWASHLIYRDHGLQVSSDELMGMGPVTLSDDGYKLLRSYDQEMSQLLEHVHIYDGKPTLERMIRIIRKRAADLGVLYETIQMEVYKDGHKIATISTDNYEDTATERLYYIDLEHNGEKFRLYDEEKRYFMHNPKTFVFICLDGIGLMTSSDHDGERATLNAISEVLARTRDVYGFSPVVVSQQNRAISNVERAKLHKGSLSPQLEDIQSSSRMAHDSDVAVALFDPFDYKAYNTKGMYGGYNILEGMMHPKGFSRFRSIHIKKNTFGLPSKVFGLKFLGESNHFETLPKAEDILELNKVYGEISLGL